MLYSSFECGSISIMHALLRTIYCNTYVYTFHVRLCLLALTFVCNSTYLLKFSFQIYQKSIVVFIRSSKVWFKTTSCAKGFVTRCNFPGNLQRNSTLKRCKFVMNVWWKRVFVNFTSTKSKIVILPSPFLLLWSQPKSARGPAGNRSLEEGKRWRRSRLATVV